MKRIAIVLFTLILSAPAMAANAVNFRVELSGDNEVPPVDTDTSGVALLHVNQALTEIEVKLDVMNGVNLLGAAGAHLHCAPVGVNGGVVVFLAGPFTPGFDGWWELRATLNDQSIINPACGETILDLVDSMLDGNVYLNVHSTDFPGGVIRGQVQ